MLRIDFETRDPNDMRESNDRRYLPVDIEVCDGESEGALIASHILTAEEWKSVYAYLGSKYAKSPQPDMFRRARRSTLKPTAQEKRRKKNKAQRKARRNGK